MTPGDIAALIAASVLAALVSVIGFLLKGRFDTQHATITEIKATINALQAQLQAQAVLLAQLSEAQRAVAANQATISHVQEKLVDDAEEVEDVVSQLQYATQTLRDRVSRHENFLKQLRESD